MAQLASKLSEALIDDMSGDLVDLVGVGNSGSRFARYISPDIPGIPVVTVRFDRDRWLRELTAQSVDCLPEAPIVCDDVFISGATICSVVAQLGLKPRAVAVGLSYNSKTARKRLGAPIIEGLRYGRLGGGCPPMNSISTLVSGKGKNLLENLSDKYFEGRSTELKTIIERL